MDLMVDVAYLDSNIDEVMRSGAVARQSLNVGIGLVVASILTTCMLSAAAMTRSAPVAAAETPSGLGNIDPACAGGHGLQIDAKRGGIIQDLQLVSQSPTRTLIGFLEVHDPYSPRAKVIEPFTVYAIGPHCRVERGFGFRGVVRPRLPGGRPSWDFNGIDALRGGGFVVTADDRRSWWIGRFNPDGSVDRSFGSDGWLPLLPPGAQAGYQYPNVVSVVEEPRGELIADGNDARPHADTLSFAMAVTPGGHPDLSWGHDGYIRLFESAAYVGQLVELPDGDLVADGSIGGGGYFTTLVKVFGPSGQSIPWLTANLHNLVTPVGPGGTEDSVVVPTRDGGIVSVEQLDLSERALAAVTSSDLGPDADYGVGGYAVLRLTGRHPSLSSAVEVGGDGDLVVSSFGSGGDLDFQDLSSTGQPLLGFGHRGTVQQHLPGGQLSDAADPVGPVSGFRDDFVYAFSSGIVVHVIARVG